MGFLSWLSGRKSAPIGIAAEEAAIKQPHATGLRNAADPRHGNPDHLGIVFDRVLGQYVTLTPEEFAAAGLVLPKKLFSATDEELDALAAEVEGRWFHAKLVGVTYRNLDGTRRQQLLEDECEGNEYDLVPEPDNEHDPNAVMVMSTFGEQLGYLEARLAGEVVRGLARGQSYTCFLKGKTGGYDGKKLGAVLAIVTWQQAGGEASSNDQHG